MDEELDFGHPNVVSVLRAVLQEDFPDDFQAKSIQIWILENGDCSYRLYDVRGGDYVGGVARVDEGA